VTSACGNTKDNSPAYFLAVQYRSLRSQRTAQNARRQRLRASAYQPSASHLRLALLAFSQGCHTRASSRLPSTTATPLHVPAGWRGSSSEPLSGSVKTRHLCHGEQAALRRSVLACPFLNSLPPDCFPHLLPNGALPFHLHGIRLTPCPFTPSCGICYDARSASRGPFPTPASLRHTRSLHAPHTCAPAGMAPHARATVHFTDNTCSGTACFHAPRLPYRYHYALAHL